LFANMHIGQRSGIVVACCLLLAPHDRQQANAQRATLPSRSAMTCLACTAMHQGRYGSFEEAALQETQRKPCIEGRASTAIPEKLISQSTPKHDIDDTLTAVRDV